MNYFEVVGENQLFGSIQISGAKNAALPLLCLGLLTEKDLILDNIPAISDVLFVQKLLGTLGVSITTHKKQRILCTPHIISHHAPRNHVTRTRASILTLGALLGRCGEAHFFMPGGCGLTTGTRPINYHLEGLKAMGVALDFDQDAIIAKAPSGRVPGGRYTFPQPSVTGTLNLVFAGVLGKGETVLHNIATEPEILDTIDCLKKMGACITQSEKSLYIQGKDVLDGAVHTTLADRIEMGTYMVAAAITQGDLTLYGKCVEHLSTPIQHLKQMGVGVDVHDPGCVRVFANDRPEAACIATGPFPAFPTDLQAQFMALLCMARGQSTVTENIWDNRFMHVAELVRAGAHITTNGNKATITGQSRLHGSDLYATDLRASVSLILAGLAAQGKTTVHHIHHLDRGYAHLEDKLRACGAQIQRITHENKGSLAS